MDDMGGSGEELWEMETFRTSFTIKAAYDVLPSPKNLNQWYGVDPTCLLCQTPATLKHILVGCKTSLKVVIAGIRPEAVGRLRSEALVPADIVLTNLRPEFVLWSASLQLVYIIEATVLWRMQWGRPSSENS